MKFEDVLFLIQLGSSAASLATGNPLIAVNGEAATRLLKIGHDAYVSGRERGEWTAEQEKHFDEVVLPTITSQPHWQG